MSEELKPCKCGAIPKVRKRKVELIRVALCKEYFKYFVECQSCFSSDGVGYNTKAEAIEAWNRRAE